eukprot:g13101.t1
MFQGKDGAGLWTELPRGGASPRGWTGSVRVEPRPMGGVSGWSPAPGAVSADGAPPQGRCLRMEPRPRGGVWPDEEGAVSV